VWWSALGRPSQLVCRVLLAYSLQSEIGVRAYRVSPVHKLLHPPATAPYAIPKQRIPANVWARTPQRMKVTSEVVKSVPKPSSQGENLSDNPPMASRDTTEATIGVANFNDRAKLKEWIRSHRLAWQGQLTSECRQGSELLQMLLQIALAAVQDSWRKKRHTW
jgi:hypothetical protein